MITHPSMISIILFMPVSIHIPYYYWLSSGDTIKFNQILKFQDQKTNNDEEETVGTASCKGAMKKAIGKT